MKHFGARLQAKRKACGFTRRSLAQQAKLHETHLAKIERGERTQLQATTVKKLARALGCTTDYLLGMDTGDDEEDAAA